MKWILLIAASLLVGLASGQLSASRNQDCKDNESFNTCGSACEPSCDTPTPSFCTLQCVVGCQCDSGFLRRKTDNACVKQTDCKTPIQPPVLPAPNNTCGANEENNDCHNPCTEKKCPQKDAPMVNCLMACSVGCSCKKGFVRNMKGECVKETECPAIDNENPCNLAECRTGFKCVPENGKATCIPDYSDTPSPIPLSDPAGNHTDINIQITPCSTMRCASGTECQNLERNCTTPPCETYGACVNTTVVDNLAGGCDTMRCEAGETCQEALVKCAKAPCPRHAMCVLDMTQNDTLNSCASVSCPVGESCEETTVQCFVAPCPKAVSCVPMNIHQNSTARQGCDVVRCRSNEVCEEQQVACLMAPCPIQVACVSVIHTNGTNTNSTHNTNSTTSPANACPRNQTMSDCLNKCSEAKCPGIGISMMCTKHCGQGCACAAGFVRSSDGECYKTKDCPAEQVCGENEEYRCEKCSGTCKNSEPNCPGAQNKNCNKKCICAAGFVKKNGKCVTLASCPDHDHSNITCLGTQDFTDCLPKCRQLCSGSMECDKNMHTEMCTPGCVCKPSYKLDSNGTCVHNRHCFKTTDCPVNEEWSKCVSDDNVCGLATIQKVPLRDQCFSGCICASGFARNSNGTCVEQAKC